MLPISHFQIQLLFIGSIVYSTRHSSRGEPILQSICSWLAGITVPKSWPFSLTGFNYNIIRVPPQKSQPSDSSLQGAEVLCTIEPEDRMKPSYYHSFGEKTILLLSRPFPSLLEMPERGGWSCESGMMKSGPIIWDAAAVIYHTAWIKSSRTGNVIWKIKLMNFMLQATNDPPEQFI